MYSLSALSSPNTLSAQQIPYFTANQSCFANLLTSYPTLFPTKYRKSLMQSSLLTFLPPLTSTNITKISSSDITRASPMCKQRSKLARSSSQRNETIIARISYGH